MQLPELTVWLTQPTDYVAGVVLYEQLGGRALYRQLFAAGETSYSRQLLERELQRLATGLAPVPVPTRPTPPAPTTAPVVPVAAMKSTPTPTALLQPLREQLRGLRDERSQLHAQLTAPRLSEKDRGQFALRILTIGDLVVGLLRQEQHVLAHGTLPPGPVALADVVDPGELQKRLHNLVANRSKVRKNLKRAAELPAIEAAIQLIREKLTVTTRVQ
jgi:hypothetical protein